MNKFSIQLHFKGNDEVLAFTLIFPNLMFNLNFIVLDSDSQVVS